MHTCRFWWKGETFAPVPGVAKQREGFFLNYSGKVMTGRQITRRVTELVRKAFPNQNLSFHVSRLRKHIVTSHCGWENPSVSATDLASQMSHNVRTAEKHYHVKDEIMQKARMGRYLEASIQETNQPSTSREHVEPSAPGKRKRMERCALEETSSSLDDDAPPPPHACRPNTYRLPARKGQQLFTSREMVKKGDTGPEKHCNQE